MEEYNFQSELKNYKVIRRADYHKIYYSKKYYQVGPTFWMQLIFGTIIVNIHYHEWYGDSLSFSQALQHNQKHAKNKKVSAANEKSGKPLVTEGKGFWELMESTLKGTLTPVEINKFLAALRQVIWDVIFLSNILFFELALVISSPTHLPLTLNSGTLTYPRKSYLTWSREYSFCSAERRKLAQ